MNPRTTLLRVAATSGVAAVLCGMVAAPAVAADGDVDVINTETVQVYTSPTGEVDTQRVYEQLILTGTGSVDLSNPISTDGLRNLEGFGGVDVEGGEQVTEMTVDGEEHLRTVSDFEGDLPLDVSVAYKLDGEPVEPGDIVGESGELEVLYTVKNITAQPQEVSFPDGSGGTTTETVDVPIPMVGSLSTVAPETFTNVKSDQANMAGDGKGGTKLSFTMTLFPPIGSDTAEFGYTADIVDGVVPRSDVSALPVNPLESPTFAAAADSYQGGTDTGARLAEGAATIDSNLLKLRDGAAELLAGLIKLRNGSEQLETGLADEAAPGAEKLADGAGQLDDGLGRIADGANRLFDGTALAAAGGNRLADGAARLDNGLTKLDGGVGDLDTGATRLAAGQKALARGLKTLYNGVDMLPKSVQEELAGNQDYQQLLGALGKIARGVGTRSDSPTAGTLLGGVNAVQYGMRHPAGYAANDCGVALAGGTPTTCGAMDGVQFVAEQLAQGATDLDQLKPVLGILNGTSNAGAPCPGYPNYAPPPNPPTNPCQAVSTVYYGLFGNTPVPLGAQAKVRLAAGALQGIQQKVGEQLLAPGAGLDQIRAGLSTGADPATCPADPSPCGIKEAALFLQQYGVPALVAGITDSISAELLTGIGAPTAGCDPEATLRCGAAALVAGGGDLTAGVDKLVAGVTKLNDGGALLAGGADELSSGLGELNAGAGKLADGTTEAADGSGRLADGADKLAEGLADAAEGSGRLSAGLGQAADGAPKLVDGAQKLSDKGTSKLVEAGEDTTQTYGQMYATMQAGAERAQAEDMAYGAPEGAAGLTAYSYVIQGEDGEAVRNWQRGLAGMALLGLAGGGFLLRRRLI